MDFAVCPTFGADAYRTQQNLTGAGEIAVYGIF